VEWNLGIGHGAGYCFVASIWVPFDRHGITTFQTPRKVLMRWSHQRHSQGKQAGPELTPPLLNRVPIYQLSSVGSSEQISSSGSQIHGGAHSFADEKSLHAFPPPFSSSMM